MSAAADLQFPDDAAIARVATQMMDCALPAAEWTHAAHWAVSLWLCVHRTDLHLPADMPGMIRRYNESAGGQNTDTSGYHETITQASLRAARAWRLNAAEDEPVSGTLARLLASPLGRPVWLMTYWSRERLMSVEARRDWVEPDLAPFAYPPYPARSPVC